MKGKITDYFSAVLTCLLLLTSFYIIGDIFDRNLIIILMFLCLLGFIFSYITKGRGKIAKEIVSIIILCAVFFYMGVNISGSFLNFENTIFILMRGLLFIGVIYCFNSYNKRTLFYIRSISLTLFLYSFLFVNTNNSRYGFIVLLYVFIWLLIARFSIPYSYKNFFQALKIIFAAFGVFLLAAGITVILKNKVNINRAKYKDMFLKNFEMEDEALKFYDSLYEKISNMGAKFIKEKKEGLQSFSFLMKEPALIRETEEARLRLKSLIKEIEGGFNKKNIQEKELLEEYLNKKTYDKTEKIKQELLKEIMGVEGDLSAKLAAGFKLNEIERQDVLEKVDDDFDSLNKIIEEISSDSQVKQKLKESADDFKQWKVYAMYNEARTHLENEISSLEEGKEKLLKTFDKIEENFSIRGTQELQEEVKSMDNISGDSREAQYLKEGFQKMLGIKKELILMEVKSIKVEPGYLKVIAGNTDNLKAAAVYSDGSEENAADFVIWNSSNPRNAIVEKGKVFAFKEGETDVYARLKEIESNHVNVIVESMVLIKGEEQEGGNINKPVFETPQLISIVLGQQKISLRLGQMSSISATGYYKDGSQRDITGIADWFVENKNILTAADKGILKAKRLGRTDVYVQYGGIKSLPLRVSVFITAGEVLKMFFYVLAGGIVIGFIIFFIAAVIETIKFKKMLKSNPSQFIKSLYENARKVLDVCGLPSKKVIPFIEYADNVDNKFFPGEDKFSKFTCEFLETQYSGRIIITPEYAAGFLNSYQTIMKGVRKKTSVFFIKFFIMLFRRYPFF